MSLKPSPLKSPVPTIAHSVVMLPGTPLPITVATSISQISTSPLLVSYQTMSVLPSPLKSPVATGGLALARREPPPITEVPLVSQTTIAGPALALYQRMSAKPSPLKSPVPTIDQSLVAEPNEAPPVGVAPFISHTSTCPLVPLRQRLPAKPSRLSSRWPTFARWVVAEPGEPPPIVVAPFIIHSATWPLVCRHKMSLTQSVLKSCARVGATNAQAAP